MLRPAEIRSSCIMVVYMVGEREGGGVISIQKKLLRKCHTEQSTIEWIGRYSTSAMSSANSDKELHAC